MEIYRNEEKQLVFDGKGTMHLFKTEAGLEFGKSLYEENKLVKNHYLMPVFQGTWKQVKCLYRIFKWMRKPFVRKSYPIGIKLQGRRAYLRN